MSVDRTHMRTKQCSAVPPGGTTFFSGHLHTTAGTEGTEKKLSPAVCPLW